MPKFHVILQPEAERNVAEIFDWLAERSPQGARAWYLAFKQAVKSLQESADRFPLAPESRRFDHDVRNMVFKTRRGRPYRILFTLQQTDVHVVYVRGPGQDLASP